MKKTKLALSKQTITQLTTTNLMGVAGGGPHAETRGTACASDGCTVGCATQGNCGNSVHACVVTRASC